MSKASGPGADGATTPGDGGEQLVPGSDGELITQAEAQRLHRLAIYCAFPPKPSTDAAVSFLQGGHELVHFGGFHRQLATRMDETLKIFLGDATHEEGGKVINYTKIADHYLPMMSELILTRSVDILLTYVARLMALIFTTKPETLRSKSQVEVEYILSFDSREEMLTALADDEVNRLAYLGMRQLAENLEKKLGLPLFPQKTDLGHAIDVIEARNLIVHNAGIVNRTYLKRQPHSTQQLGEQIKIASPTEAPAFLAHAVVDIDARAIAKFGLPTYDGKPPERMCYRMGAA